MAKGKNIHIVPHKDGWAARSEGAKRVIKQFNTQAKATKFGEPIAEKRNSELLIHGRNGQIRDRDSYGNDPCPPVDKKH